MTEWSETRRQLGRMVARMGVNAVAASIPADRSTVYRLIKGEVTKPSLAVKAAVERLVGSKHGNVDERRHG